MDIAGHFVQTYENLFNTKHISSNKMLSDFMGEDIDKLGKITNTERDNLAADISFYEMEDCIEDLRLSAQGGPDGMTSRLLKVIASRLPNLVHGAMIDITRGAEKPKQLAHRFLIFIDKPESANLCYKKYRPINLLSNLLKATSKVMAKRIEKAISNSGILPRNTHAYYKERSTMDVVRMVKDAINDAAKNPDSEKACMLISFDYSAAFDTVSRQMIYNVLLTMGFPRKAIRMIKNIYEGVVCRILMNDVKLREFLVTSGCPQGCIRSII